MNKFDEKYFFRLANRHDILGIMKYMEVNWSAEHIFSTNRTFFEYEFMNGDMLNIVLAISKEHNSIEAMWAFYPFSKDTEYLDVGGGPWSVRQSVDNLPFLGMELLKRAKEILKYRTMIGVGDNPKTSGFFHRRISKDFVGVLEHYYRLGCVAKYKIAKINCVRDIRGAENDLQGRLIEFHDIRELESRFSFEKYKECIPYKDSWYVDKRFFQHPKYKYKVFGIEFLGTIISLIVAKEIIQDGSVAVRLVDYIGDDSGIRYIGKDLENIFGGNYEYIDFYCHGFRREDLEHAGFILRTPEDSNIIPNYFEPFVQKNVDIGYSSTEEKIRVCKADADQDRPNYI